MNPVTSLDLPRDETARPRLLRMPEVLRIAAISRTTLWRYVKNATFPPAVRLGPNAIAWRSRDVDRWLASLPGQESGRKRKGPSQ